MNNVGVILHYSKYMFPSTENTLLIIRDDMLCFDVKSEKNSTKSSPISIERSIRISIFKAQNKVDIWWVLTEGVQRNLKILYLPLQIN